MSGTRFIIPSIFTTVDQISPGVRTMTNSLGTFTQRADAFSARSERLFRRITPAIGEAQRQLLSMVGTGALVAGAFNLGRTSAQSIMEYETSLQSLQAVTGVSNAQMLGFKKEISDLGVTSKKSSIDIAKSFETVGSMMSQYLDDPKALRQITEAGITLSKAARMELEPSLQSLTSVMNQFKLGSDMAAKSVNTLTAGEIVGSVRTNEVSNYLQEFGATASNMNVDLNESVALIEALGLQMDKTKIGVGARNLLTIISAAGGLDKKARQDLKSSGVNLKFLMDNTKSLSARLHELSKIAQDPIKMVSVFGKENLTAGQVIFNQLDTYDKWVRRIRETSEANNQAAINSHTLKNRISELGNKWTNMLTTNDKVDNGVRTITNSIVWLTDHLEGVIGTTIDVIKYFAIWKAVNVGMRVAITATNIGIGLFNALFTTSTVLTYENALAQKVYLGTSKAVGTVLNILAGDFAALNAVMLANPIGVFVIGVAALVAGVYLLSKAEEELIEKYKEKLRLDSLSNINKETDAVKKLTAEYWHLGMGISEATSKAIQRQRAQIGFERMQVEARISKTKQELAAEKNKLYVGDLFTGTFGEGDAMYGRRNELAEQLAAQQSTAKGLADKNLGLSQFGQAQVESGVIKPEDYRGIFPSSDKGKDTAAPAQWGDEFKKQEAAFAWRFYQPSQSGTTSENKNEMTVTIKNNSDNAVNVANGQTKLTDVMPKTTSTKILKNGN